MEKLPSTADFSPGKAWFGAITTILVGVFAMGSIMKVSPTMTLLIASGMVDGTAEGGWLITMASIMGIVLALPGGNLVDRFGPKAIGVVGIACGVIGNFAGAFAPSFAVLMATRVFEGISIGLVGLVGLTLISQLFPAERRGLPMSIWSCYAGMGILLVCNGANLLVDTQDPSTWVNVWLFCGIAELILLVLFAFAVKPSSPAPGPKSSDAPKVSLVAGLKSAPAWIIGGMFMCYSFGLNCILTFEPTYCTDALGLTFEQGNLYSSLFSVSMLVGGLAIGVVMERVTGLRKRLAMLVGTMAFAAIIAGTAFSAGASIIVPYLLVAGFAMQLGQAIGYTIAPETAVSPVYIGITMGILTIANNLGGFGPTVGGAVIASSGYQTLSLLLAAVGALGTLLSILLAKAMTSKTPDE